VREDFVVETLSATVDEAHLRAWVPDDLRWFEGHFEGRPMLPGIAQLLLLVQRRGIEVFGPLGREHRIVRLRFEAVIEPGDIVDVHLERRPEVDGLRLQFVVERAGTACASGAIVYRA